MKMVISKIRTGVFIDKDNYNFHSTENNTFESTLTINDSVIQKHLSSKSIFIFHKLHESRLRDEGDLVYLFNKMNQTEKANKLKTSWMTCWFKKKNGRKNVSTTCKNILAFMSKQTFNISEYEEVRSIILGYPDIKVNCTTRRKQTKW